MATFGSGETLEIKMVVDSTEAERSVEKVGKAVDKVEKETKGLKDEFKTTGTRAKQQFAKAAVAVAKVGREPLSGGRAVNYELGVVRVAHVYDMAHDRAAHAHIAPLAKAHAAGVPYRVVAPGMGERPYAHLLERPETHGVVPLDGMELAPLPLLHVLAKRLAQPLDRVLE